MATGAARIIFLLFYPAEIRGQKEAVTLVAKSGQFIEEEAVKGQLL